MVFKSIVGVTCACLAVASINANAVVLTFEDVPGGSTQNASGDMPTYNGFNFTDTLDWIDVEGFINNDGAVSGEFALINNLGGEGIITEVSDADFIFDGLWAKKWATGPDSGGDDSLFGTISGYNNENLVWEVVTGLNGSYEFYGPQAGAIDELRLDFGDNFLVDDITLSALSAVPAPAAVWLFASGLLGLIGLARRKA